MYPKFLYHVTEAPEGRAIRSEEQEVELGEGWVDTPAKFDPKYVAPPDVPADDTVPAEARAAGYVPASYPGFRYNRAGEAVVVRSAEDVEALDPAEWKETPDLTAQCWQDEAPTPATPPSSNGPGSARQPPATPLGAFTGTLSDQQKAELHAAKVQDIVARLDDVTDPAMLEAIAAVETVNPKGARTTVLKAVQARQAELSAPA